MDEDEKILHEALTNISNLKIQMGRFEADLESEKGTHQRSEKRIIDAINKVEADFRSIIYDPEKGLLLKIDRLLQESQRRESMQKNIIPLWTAVGIAILSNILTWWFKSKNLKS